MTLRTAAKTASEHADQRDEMFTTRSPPSADPSLHRALARPRPAHDVLRRPTRGRDLASQRVPDLARVALARVLCILEEGQLVALRVQLIALLCPHNTICPRYSLAKLQRGSELSRLLLLSRGSRVPTRSGSQWRGTQRGAGPWRGRRQTSDGCRYPRRGIRAMSTDISGTPPKTKATDPPIRRTSADFDDRPNVRG